MATIEPYDTRSGRRYRVRYRTPDHRQTDKRGFATKRDAQQWLAEQQVAAAKGTYVAPAAGRLLLRDAASAWIADQHQVSPSTLSRYRGIAEGTITTRFGHLPLGKITRPLVRGWIAELVDSGTPAETVHKQVGVLRRILAQAVEDGRLAVNPANGVKLPAITPTEMRFLTLEELRALATAAEDDAPAIWTLGVCGLRLGELVGLRHGDIDRSAGVLHIVRSVTVVDSKHHVGPPKGGKRRTVPLPPFIAAQLPLNPDDEALVFPAPGGGFIRHGNWRTRVFDVAVSAAGLDEELHPHELRHTAASLAIRSGANIKAVQAMLGHARASITLDRYGHLYPADVDGISSALQTMLTAECGQDVGTGRKEPIPE
ncbi:tyrosine-type recombinase/integrase [Tsukamurella sputi]|uniref:Tyrosine-type recombinase/integrase n=1 Tax=Tsukamurella sputi TaxID=2591848 RepID=A0A5C5RIR6_9ACTN|nr:tyrosine-type recombinase/integrase [Tsukamurella sputi]TWS22283.1 tyrosine-type recombinase/integrase [Tsukamurella sputi]